MSTKLIESYEKSLQQIKKEVNTQIPTLRKLSDKELESTVADIQALVEKASKTFKNFKKEIKKLDGPEKKKWDKKRKQLKTELSKMAVMFDQAQAQNMRNELFKSKSEEAPKEKKKKKRKKRVGELTVVDGKKKISDEALQEELFKDVFKFQDEGIASLQRSLNMADEASELATKAQKKLKEQREQLMRIDEEMDELGSNLKRARKELTSFMRRMATDKLIFVACAAVSCIIFISIIVVIICKVGICKLIWDAASSASGSSDSSGSATARGLTSECYICEMATNTVSRWMGWDY